MSNPLLPKGKTFVAPHIDDVRPVSVETEHGIQVEYRKYLFDFDYGTMDDWNLENLQKAGVTPPVIGEMGSGTRLEASQSIPTFVEPAADDSNKTE